MTRKLIGVIFGLSGFVGTIVNGVLKNAEMNDIIIRSLMVFWAGFLIGWLIFGHLGVGLIQTKLKADRAEMEAREQSDIEDETASKG